MPRNVEIKARVDNLAPLRTAAQALAGADGERFDQTDTFFRVAVGRLKVRQFADGSGELIAYARPDAGGPTVSSYVRALCPHADALARALAMVLPVRGVVAKSRELFIIGRTRVHLDRVRDLGTFVELEVVLADDEPLESGKVEARALMAQLGLAADSLVAEAYIDLLEAAR